MQLLIYKQYCVASFSDVVHTGTAPPPVGRLVHVTQHIVNLDPEAGDICTAAVTTCAPGVLAVVLKLTKVPNTVAVADSALEQLL